MSAPTNIAVRPAKLDRDVRPVVRRKPGVLPALQPRHLAMVELMTWGSNDDKVSGVLRDGVPLEPGMPLSLAEAAQYLGFRQRYARELMGQAIFQSALTKAVSEMRQGAKPRAMARLIELRDREGAGKAADRKVQLAAAMALLGDDAGPKPSGAPTINVGVAVTAGYCIDLSEPKGAAPIAQSASYHGPAGSVIYSAGEGETFSEE